MSRVSQHRRRLLKGSAGAIALPTLLASRPTLAADYPDGQPVRIVVPVTAGGSADTVARLLSAHMGSQIGVPFVVENITGAGGTVGAARVARTKADGHTLLLSFFAPAGTPEPILDRLADAMQFALRQPDVIARARHWHGDRRRQSSGICRQYSGGDRHLAPVDPGRGHAA